MTLIRLPRLSIGLTNDDLTPGACNSPETKDQIRKAATKTQLTLTKIPCFKPGKFQTFSNFKILKKRNLLEVSSR